MTASLSMRGLCLCAAVLLSACAEQPRRPVGAASERVSASLAENWTEVPPASPESAESLADLSWPSTATVRPLLRLRALNHAATCDFREIAVAPPDGNVLPLPHLAEAIAGASNAFVRAQQPAPSAESARPHFISDRFSSAPTYFAGSSEAWLVRSRDRLRADAAPAEDLTVWTAVARLHTPPAPGPQSLMLAQCIAPAGEAADIAAAEIEAILRSVRTAPVEAAVPSSAR